MNDIANDSEPGGPGTGEGAGPVAAEAAAGGATQLDTVLPEPAAAPAEALAELQPAATPADGMGDEIDLLKQQIKAGDDAKAKLQVLQPLYDKKAKAKADYQAKRQDLVNQWQRQRCEILHDVKVVATEDPKWLDTVRTHICTPLTTIRKEQADLAALQQALTLLKASADAVDTPVKQAERSKAEADKLQQAWLDISSSLGKRLNDFDIRRGKLKASTAKPSAPANQYILFFDLLPDLLALAPTDAKADVQELTQVQDKLPCPPLDAKPPPRLVTVDELSKAQDDAWAAFEAAQAALAKAVREIADQQAALQTAKSDLDAHIANPTALASAAAAPAYAA